MDSTLGTEAIQYASRGWHVFPLVPRNKAPLTDHGFYDASTDPATIREWWRRWPRANIGIRTGVFSRLVVIFATRPQHRGELVETRPHVGKS